MKLGELLEGLDVRRIDGDLNVEITGLSYDSRQTRPGHLYFSTARDATRNRANIDDALNRGARAVVVGGWAGGTARPAVTVVGSERPRDVQGKIPGSTNDCTRRARRAIEPREEFFATLFPGDAGMPLASNLNYTEGLVAPNAFIVGIADDGTYKLFSQSSTDPLL